MNEKRWSKRTSSLRGASHRVQADGGQHEEPEIPKPMGQADRKRGLFHLM